MPSPCNHTHCQVAQKSPRTNQSVVQELTKPIRFAHAQKNKINLCRVGGIVRFETDVKHLLID